jgi:hypothetical protein
MSSTCKQQQTREHRNNHNSQRTTSPSEEEEDILCLGNDNNEWQIVRGAEGKRTRRIQQKGNGNIIELSNACESQQLNKWMSY